MKKFWFLFYNITVVPFLYTFIRFAGLFNKKVVTGLKGRKRLFEEFNT